MPLNTISDENCKNRWLAIYVLITHFRAAFMVSQKGQVNKLDE